MQRMLSTALLALAAASCQAAQFQLMVYEHPAELAKRPDTGPGGQAYWAGYDSYGKALQAAGVLRGGGALVPTAGRSVRLQGGQTQVATLADSGVQLGGWFVIEVPDVDSALAWAAKAPSAASGGRVEVRLLAAVPGMAR